MSRSSALTTIAANVHAQWGLLIDVADIPTTLQLTTLDDQPTDFTAYRAWILNTVCAIGPELDWRGGLAAEEPFSIVVQNGFSSATGTSTENTFERWFALFSHDNYTGSKSESVLLNGGSGDVTVKLASYDGVPTGQSTTIFTGKTRNAAMDDYAGLQLEFESKLRAPLGRAFLARLGREPSGQENYDTVVGRTIVPQSDGQPVPIVYGIVPYAEGLFVHEESTQDDTARSGLILCFSDIRFDTLQNDGMLNQPYLFVYDGATDEIIEVMDEDLESGTSGQLQYTFIYTGGPETNLVLPAGGGSAPATGYIVRFMDNGDTVGTDEAPGLARGGKLLLRRTTPLVSVGYVPAASGGGALWTDQELGSDDDDTTLATTALVTGASGESLGSRRYYSWMVPQMPFAPRLYRLFLLPKYTHTGTAGTQNTRAWHTNSTLTQASYDYVTAATTNLTSSSFNSWTGADSPFRFGWSPGTAPADFARFRVQFSLGINATSGMTTNFNVYGADLQIWYDEDWREYRNKIYAYVSGVRDDTYELTSGSGETLRNPAEVFWHFCAEVADLPVDSSNLSTIATQMQNDGLKIDGQLTDGEESAEEFLDRLARQFMCHIYRNDSGQLRMTYRSSGDAPLNPSDPITMDDVIKGTFRTYLTDADELYAGVIVNYKWNAAREKYEGQWAITPTGHEIETNVSSPTEYQGLADMVDVDRERVLEVNADLIQDDGTAETLCKWLLQQHCRRRQVIEFETFLERFAITQGDTICVDTPHIRVFASASGGTATTGPTLINITGTTKYPATSAGYACHSGDYMIVESGAQAGYYVVYPAGLTSVGVTYAYPSAPTAGVVGPMRVIPTFDVLSARIVYDKQKGPRMAIKAVEHPVIRAGSTSI